MAAMPADSVDAIVTDPPYGLSFMGKGWDHGVPGIPFWLGALRVAKPGAHLLAFGGTRTFHRLAVAIEDAGWEMRDTVMWVYGSGFPKSLDVGKAIDKAAGAEREAMTTRAAADLFEPEREVVKARTTGIGTGRGSTPIMGDGNRNITAPATVVARQWEGWGTALKPAWEPIIVARKPLVGTVAENVLAHGTGALNIDGCRIGGPHTYTPRLTHNVNLNDDGWAKVGADVSPVIAAGRWPANLIHDGSDEVVALAGDAARFFYCAKASKADRNEGCESMQLKAAFDNANGNMGGNMGSRSGPRQNNHPTVKPTALMRYLVRLVTPPSGTVLDPFMGSGSTGKAAALEGCGFIGIELDAEYIEIARARIAHALQSNKQQTLQL